MAKRDSWMPLYIGDYLADTQHLGTLEHGAYLLLIMAYWRNGGPLPDDDDTLRRIAKVSRFRWKNLRNKVALFFEFSDQKFWRHKRIDAELAKAEAIANARVAGGIATAAKRWRDSSANSSAYSSTVGTRAGRYNHSNSKKVKNLKGDLGVAALPCAHAREEPAEPPEPAPLTPDEIVEVEALVGQATATLRGEVPKGVGDAAAYKAAVKANKFHNLVTKLNAWAGSSLDGEAQWAAWEVLAAAEAAGARAGMAPDIRRNFDTLARMHQATEPIAEPAELAA